MSRYDGNTFTTLTREDGLANNEIQAMLQDREGDLWFGTKGGVSRYDGKTFVTWTEEDGLASNIVRSIVQDREGYLWFGTEAGVSRYDGKSRSSSDPDTETSEHIEQTFTTWTEEGGLTNNNVRAVVQDREGYLWFGTDGGVSRYGSSLDLGLTDSGRSHQPRKRTFKNLTTDDGLVHNQVFSLAQDKEGYLWFGTRGGVSKYDGKVFTNFTTSEGLPTNRVSTLHADKEGTVWIGTRGGGVCQYDSVSFEETGRAFTTFTTEDGLAHGWVYSIIRDREGYLWFGTRAGVSRYDEHYLTTFTQDDGLASRAVNTVLEDNTGDLWFGTWDGAIRYDGKTFTTFSSADGLIDDDVWSLFQDSVGNIWVGTNGGLSRFDGRIFTNFTTQDGLPDDEVSAILQARDGTLWFGTEDGVSRYDGETFTNFTTEAGLADNEVESVFQDRDGTFWFGTEGGLSRYDGKTFTNFTTEDGLAGNDVRSIFQDRAGMLWFGTWGGGASCYDGQIFQTLTRRDGLSSNSVVSILQDHNGDLWFANPDNGVTRYRMRSAVPPSVFIDAVVADRRYEGSRRLDVQYGAGLTAFEFRGISLKTRPEAMVYRYRLVGHDPNWYNTRTRRVEYQDLSPGSYTFEVLAVSRDLIPSEKPATVSFRILLPYAQIGWGAAMSLALGMIVWQAIRIVQRGRKLHASNRALQEAHDTLEVRVVERTTALHESNTRLKEEVAERERTERSLVRLERLRALGELSAGISHNLNNILTGVMGPALMLKSRNTDPETTRGIEEIIRSGLRARDLVSRLHKAVRGQDDGTEPVDVNIVVQNAVQDARPRWKDEAEAKGITIEVVTETQDVPTIRGNTSGMHDIVINLLFNAIDAMPKGGTIHVSTAPCETGTRLVVTDTGHGMDKETLDRVFEPFFTTKMDVGTGLGLSTVYGTVTRWGGQIDLESEPGIGTTFVVSLQRWKGFEPTTDEFPRATIPGPVASLLSTTTTWYVAF